MLMPSCASSDRSGGQAASERLAYPATRKVDQVDDYHGTKVADPYRWLENDVRVDAEVASWVAEQLQGAVLRIGAVKAATAKKLSAKASKRKTRVVVRKAAPRKRKENEQHA